MVWYMDADGSEVRWTAGAGRCLHAKGAGMQPLPYFNVAVDVCIEY